jgi:membrane-associated phospholipid phosphatase
MVAQPDSVLYTQSHRKWYVAGFVAAIVIFTWAAFIAHHHVLTGWERRLLLDVNNWPNAWRRYFIAIAFIGGSAWTAVVGVIITFLMKMYRLAWRLAASFLLATALVSTAKHLISRAQPVTFIPQLHVRVAVSGTAFPSGATTIATIVSLSLLPYLPRYWRSIIPIWIVAVGLSRLYLGVYAPLDVIGGLALGVFLVSLIRIMPQSLRVFLRLD